MIDTEQFSECFSNWMADLSNLVEEDIIAVDGKCLRRSPDNYWLNLNPIALGEGRFRVMHFGLLRLMFGFG